MGQFTCYHCSGIAFRFLTNPKDTVECLRCGRASPFNSQPPVFAHIVEITIDGQNYGGSYTVEGSTVTVRCGMNVKSAQLGGMATSAETLARMLLAEIVSDGKRVDRE
jgi:hypothetical protein